MDTAKAMLLPPVSFAILLIAITLFAKFLTALAFRRKERGGDMRKSYACGEDVPSHLIQPDYGQFFPFAFFFTVLHVVALTISTVPAKTLGSFMIALIYIAGAAIGLVILFRR